MKAPRLFTRALVTSFVTVAIVLGAVFAVLSLRVRDQVRQRVADNLASAQQVFTRVEARRQRDMRASVATLAENPTLIAALDTWVTERGQTQAALVSLAWIGLGAMSLAVLGSVWLARTLTQPHIPIVELHHERPDGRGYPYGLRGADIPLAARIVHVADAFDAMTSARAHRSGRLPVEAVVELRRCIGTDFDGPAVEALIAALPRLASAVDPVSRSSMEAHWGRSGGTARGRWSSEADRASHGVETLR